MSGNAPPPQRVRIRLLLLAAALLLPALSLVPLGSLWLWQNGYVLVWALATCFVVLGCYALLARTLDPFFEQSSVQDADENAAPPRWSERQEAAWRDVLALADTVPPERLGGREEVLSLGLEAISLVANRLHPERSDPLLRFTLPEAFAVIAQASGGLREFALTHLPFGDRITVAQIMWLYRWRTVLPVVEKGYDLWRVVRLLNPISAATQELRERYTRQLYQMSREHVAKRLAAAYVKEVGKAAIDLYGGSLRVSAARLSTHVSGASRRDADALEAVAAEPIRILLVGQAGAGKSSLINLLTGSLDAEVDVVPVTRAQTAYRIVREGLPAALLVDTPGLDAPDAIASGALAGQVEDCDMLVLVLAATRAARAPERDTLEHVKRHFEGLGRRPPPVLVVLTHIDRLRPFNEWAPPLDIVHGTSEKAKSVRSLVETVARELEIPGAAIVPVRADAPATAYNIDALWARIMEALPEAKRARLSRCLQDAAGSWSWTAVLSQAANAGRVLARTVLQRDPSRPS